MVKKTYITLKNNLMQKFLSDKVFINSVRQTLNINEHKIVIDTHIYKGFYIVNVNKIIDLINISENSDIFIYRDFIDVTDNYRFNIGSILLGLVCSANIVLEGTDGVGKSTIARQLANVGYLCEDRCVEEITKMMKPEISQDTRLSVVSKYLDENKMKKVVFLYLSDEAELLRRIQSKTEISDYDKQALVYQKLYVETFYKLRNYSNLHLIDCSNKSIKQMVYEVFKLI